MTTELHRQTCQSCGSRTLKILLYRESGEPDKAFAQCAECDELVARYVIQPGGYYHHGKGFESYLRGITRGGGFMSGKDLHKDFEKLQSSCLRRFDEIRMLLKEKKD
ncbi:MAG: hypothetical protein OEY59_10480 [Deltaproteobacteria bacterium]|nr:hypothetical protein [Deltaproteobacteria bacterium]